MRAAEAVLEDSGGYHAEFVAELLRRRIIAGLSQGALGVLMGYDRTYVNKVERGIQRELRDDEVRFRWSTARPPLAARYRLEWKFRGGAAQ